MPKLTKKALHMDPICDAAPTIIISSSSLLSSCTYIHTHRITIWDWRLWTLHITSRDDALAHTLTCQYWSHDSIMASVCWFAPAKPALMAWKIKEEKLKEYFVILPHEKHAPTVVPSYYAITSESRERLRDGSICFPWSVGATYWVATTHQCYILDGSLMLLLLDSYIWAVDSTFKLLCRGSWQQI